MYQEITTCDLYLDGIGLNLVKSAITFVRVSLGSEAFRRQEVREPAPVATEYVVSL